MIGEGEREIKSKEFKNIFAFASNTIQTIELKF